MNQSEESLLSRDLEPIAALSSGRDPSAIAVIRLSGQDCLTLARGIVKPLGSKAWEPGKMRLCQLKDPVTGEVVDEPMAVSFHGPASYTGQDSMEVYLHGGPWIVQRVLGIFFHNGFRPADPGEFTRRAWLNGKMDLTEAEGIRTLVEASSEQQWLAARQLATGRLKQDIEDLRRLVMEAMAWLEARIDFPDEKETSEVEWQQVDERVSRAGEAVNRLLDSFASGRVAAQGLRVTIFGRPNAGKSTLLNHLLDQERAIVSATPGTTRDYIEEPCLINGRLIRLVDTAGIREEAEVIEQVGIDRAMELARESDVMLCLLPADADEADHRKMEELITDIRPSSVLRVMTKSDLSSQGFTSGVHSWLPVSCLKNQGTEALKKALADLVDRSLEGISSDKTFITTARHRQALLTARKFLDAFDQGRSQGSFEEMLAFELLEVARALGSVIGDVDSDDILGVVFSSFCVGK